VTLRPAGNTAQTLADSPALRPRCRRLPHVTGGRFGWSAVQPSIEFLLEQPTVMGGMAFDSAGRLLGVGYLDGTVRMWGTDTGQLRHCFDAHPHSYHAVAFSPDGWRLVTGGDDGLVRVWDTVTGKPVDGLLPRRHEWDENGTDLLDHQNDADEAQ
jgi:WD40 repeat protein